MKSLCICLIIVAALIASTSLSSNLETVRKSNDYVNSFETRWKKAQIEADKVPFGAPDRDFHVLTSYDVKFQDFRIVYNQVASTYLDDPANSGVFSENFCASKILNTANLDQDVFFERVLEVTKEQLKERADNSYLWSLFTLYITVHEVIVKLVAAYAFHKETSRIAAFCVLLSPIFSTLSTIFMAHYVQPLGELSQAGIIALQDQWKRKSWLFVIERYLDIDHFLCVHNAGIVGKWTVDIIRYLLALTYYFALATIVVNGKVLTRLDFMAKCSEMKNMLLPVRQEKRQQNQQQQQPKIKCKLLKLCLDKEFEELKQYIRECHYKINVNEVLRRDGNTILHIVSEAGLVEAVETLAHLHLSQRVGLQRLSVTK